MKEVHIAHEKRALAPTKKILCRRLIESSREMVGLVLKFTMDGWLPLSIDNHRSMKNVENSIFQLMIKLLIAISKVINHNFSVGINPNSIGGGGVGGGSKLPCDAKFRKSAHVCTKITLL